MTGEKDLERLLRDLSPRRIAGEFVFCSSEKARYGEHADLAPFAAVLEDEGLTLVMPRSKAEEHGSTYESVQCGITTTSSCRPESSSRP